MSFNFGHSILSPREIKIVCTYFLDLGFSPLQMGARIPQYRGGDRVREERRWCKGAKKARVLFFPSPFLTLTATNVGEEGSVYLQKRRKSALAKRGKSRKKKGNGVITNNSFFSLPSLPHNFRHEKSIACRTHHAVSAAAVATLHTFS